MLTILFLLQKEDQVIRAILLFLAPIATTRKGIYIAGNSTVNCSRRNRYLCACE